MSLFENFPYTNLHQLNLDWLVAEMKKVEDTIKYGPVVSVNGLTGEVVLYQEANVRLPDVMNPTQTNWNIFRYLNGHVYGIEFDATGNVYQIQDQYRRKLLTWADIPPESGVISINGKYGVVRLYGSDIQTSGDDPKTVMESIYDLEEAVTDINSSIDDLDELTSTLQTISNAVKNSLAYVENTNTATHNMSAGTYVLWNNGAYKVKAGTNIAIGDTLSSSNLDAIGTKGFINDLNDSITALNDNIGGLTVKYGSFTRNVTATTISGGIAADRRDVNIDIGIPTGKTIRAISIWPTSDYLAWIGRIVVGGSNIIRMYVYHIGELNDNIIFSYIAWYS